MRGTVLTEESSRKARLFPATRLFLAFLRREAGAFLAAIGMLVNNTRVLIGFLAKGQFSWRHFIQQAAFVGMDTLGISLILTTFSGMVIALQIAKEMVKQGAGSYVGALVSMSLLRELGPIMTGFAVIALAGSAFAAELATMQITSQVSAMRVLHVHPMRYLMLPRVLACMVILPLMTILTAYSGILGGLVIANWIADVNTHVYLDSVLQQTAPKDLIAMIVKASIFGYVIAMLSTSIGLSTQGGAREVGLATTRAVVWSFVAMALLDYLLTYMFYGA